MVKIIVSITSGSNNTERNILRSFYEGLERHYFEQYNAASLKDLKRKSSIELELNYDPEIKKCDIAVQFGTVKDRMAEHHITKQSIRKNAKHIVYIETPLLGRVIDKKNNYAFYRIGVDGYLHNDGEFFDEGRLEKGRLEFIRSTVEVPTFPGWKDHRQGNILILMQIPGDASLRGQKIGEWLMDTIYKIRCITDRQIWIRFHPATSEKARGEIFSELQHLFFNNYKDINFGDGITTTLDQDLNNAGICVSYTSGSSIDAVLKGVPVIAMDMGNLVYPISSHHIEEIHNPKLAPITEIDNWLLGLANSQWTETEMKLGKVWQHILPILEEAMKNDNIGDISQNDSECEES